MEPDYILPSFGANNQTITASGFSGGSFWSTLQHTIDSDLIKGVGLFNGGIYGDKIFEFDQDWIDESIKLARDFD